MHVCIHSFIDGSICLCDPLSVLGARTRTRNKHNPLITLGPGFDPGSHWWEASVITTAPSLLPKYTFSLLRHLHMLCCLRGYLFKFFYPLMMYCYREETLGALRFRCETAGQTFNLLCSLTCRSFPFQRKLLLLIKTRTVQAAAQLSHWQLPTFLTVKSSQNLQLFHSVILRASLPCCAKKTSKVRLGRVRVRKRTMFLDPSGRNLTEKLPKLI